VSDTTPEIDALAAGVRSARRRDLGRAITLVESTRPEDRALADALLSRLSPGPTTTHRVGITGVPGVGKSTLIEALGLHLCAHGHRVAVLAVDPSSARSGGSILGDKTRMTELSRHPSAFIRPTPAAGALGGVARHTRETIAVVEAAGYDVVLVETVGVGQSEVMVAHMVDTFVVLALAGGGDELQGIKRGILELCDLLAITKADGANVPAARNARGEYARALALVPPRDAAWSPRVLTCSAVTGEGLSDLWHAVAAHRQALEQAGAWEGRRAEQRVRWLWQALETSLVDRLRADPAVAAALAGIQAEVRAGTVSPDRAAEQLLLTFLGSHDTRSQNDER
jgi:LAO/AO transport system kinase